MKKGGFWAVFRAYLVRRWWLLLIVAAISFCIGFAVGELLKFV